MDAEDWAFLRKFGLFTLGGVAILSAIIFYFHSTAEPVTPSTSSKTSRTVSSYSGDTSDDIAFIDTTKAPPQKLSTSQANASTTATAARNDDSSSEGWLQVILILSLLGGIGVYIARGGRLGYLRQPWQTF